MRRTAFFLALSLLCIKSNTSAQKAAETTGGISVAKIFEGYLSATGGVNAHKELTTLKVSGSFGFPNYTVKHPAGAYTFLYKAPSKDIFEMQVTSHGTSWAGRRDDHVIRRLAPDEPGFSIAPGGVGFIDGDTAQNVERGLMSLLEWDIHKYRNIELIGKANIDRRLAYALRFTPQQGDPQVRYYDMETFLLVRMDQLQRYRVGNGPEKFYGVVMYFRNYRQFGALRLPREIVIPRDPELVFEFSNVKYGEEISDSAFRD